MIECSNYSTTRTPLHLTGAARGRRARSTALLGAFVAVVLVAAWGTPTTLAADRLIFTQIPAQAADGRMGTPLDFGVERDLPPGSRIAAFDPNSSTGNVTVLTSGFVTAGRPDLSFDGKRILFVGKHRAVDPFHMWEMDTNGGNPRRITDWSGNIHRAIYLSTIYTIDADKPVYQIGFHGDADGIRRSSLYTCRVDGTRIRRITCDPNGVSDPYQLSDGRLLFSRWSSVDVAAALPGARGTDLMTVHTDGADVFPFAATHEPPAVRSMPCETPDGWVVYVESKVGSPDCGGSLVAVARTRSLHSRHTVASDTDGFYQTPYAMKDGKLLVSYRAETGGSYGIYVLDPSTGTRIAKVFDDPKWHEVDALVVGPRRIPDGRSSVVDERIATGLLYCLDVYLSDREQGKAITPGQIKRLRVFRADADGEQASHSAPVYRGNGRHGDIIRDELLGEVPVETDGSFFLEVPARTPLRFETLDAEGNVLQSMQSWIWVMPSGRRGCIGCHEDRELTPPNRHVSALRTHPRKVGVAARPHSPFGAGPSRVPGGQE